MKAIIREETVGRKKTIYRGPGKVQHCVHCEGSNGKVKFYSEEEVFLYRMRAFKSSFNYRTI